MPTPFGSLLIEAFRRLDVSQRAAAKLLNMSQGNISKMINGDPKVPGPPLDRIAAWADALNLSGPGRTQFLTEAHLAHCPPAIAEGWRAMAGALTLAGMHGSIPTIGASAAAPDADDVALARVAEMVRPYENPQRPARRRRTKAVHADPLG
jgi:hypothetical protein